MTVSAGELEKLGGKDLVDFTGEDIKKISVGRGPTWFLDAGVSVLEGLRDRVVKGDATIGELAQATDSLGSFMNTALNDRWARGAVGEARDTLNRLNKFIKTSAPDGRGQGEFEDLNFERAFTRRQIAQIPRESLPTRADVEKGLLPLDIFPTGLKMQEDVPDPDAPGPTTPDVVEQPFKLPVQPGQGPITPTIQPPGATPQTPGTPPVSLEPSLPQQPPQAGQPGLPQQVPGGSGQLGAPTQPGVGIGTLIGDPLRLNEALSPERQQIEVFGRRQEEQLRQLFETQEQQRRAGIQDLSQFLAGEEQRKFKEAVPGIQEGLNTQGLLRSSALGQAMARQRGQLGAETQSALLAQGLSDREAQLAQTEQILGSRLGAQQAGFEREISLEDIEREQDLARQLAAMGMPSQPTTQGGFQFGGALSGGLGGAASGAMLGSVVPGIGTGLGAAAGGIMGAVGGGSGGGK